MHLAQVAALGAELDSLIDRSHHSPVSCGAQRRPTLNISVHHPLASLQNRRRPSPVYSKPLQGSHYSPCIPNDAT